MNPQDPKYQQKLKSIASPEQNYFAHFAMRYPVKETKKTQGSSTYILQTNMEKKYFLKDTQFYN